jgi:hypothetical protein
MPKLTNRRIFLMLITILIAQLSCDSPQAMTPEPEIADPGTSEPNPTPTIAPQGSECNATASLQVSSEITLQETNQYGTRGCEYSLTIKNTDAEHGVWVYFYQHDQDGYAHTEKSHWMGNILIAPGEEGEWTGSIYIYTDPDADGPLMSIPEKMTGVYDFPECAEEKQDASFFEQASTPLDAVCPME